jgi:hypothetical protein
VRSFHVLFVQPGLRRCRHIPPLCTACQRDAVCPSKFSNNYLQPMDKHAHPWTCLAVVLLKNMIMMSQHALALGASPQSRVTCMWGWWQRHTAYQLVRGLFFGHNNHVGFDRCVRRVFWGSFNCNHFLEDLFSLLFRPALIYQILWEDTEQQLDWSVLS